MLVSGLIEKFDDSPLYFDSRQTQILKDLSRYIREKGHIPTSEKLADYLSQPEYEVRESLLRVNLEAFLFACGVE